VEFIKLHNTGRLPQLLGIEFQKFVRVLNSALRCLDLLSALCSLLSAVEVNVLSQLLGVTWRECDELQLIEEGGGDAVDGILLGMLQWCHRDFTAPTG
jgi:hypothetical protein